MNIRTGLLSACVGIFALGAASLPANAEDGRNGAAAIGAIAGFAAGAAVSQDGYGDRRGSRRGYYAGGPRYRGGDGDEDGGYGRGRRGWCYYHPGRC